MRKDFIIMETLTKKNEIPSKTFLDENIIKDFRDVMNSFPVFHADEKLKKNWSFICAAMDRIDSSVNI